MLMWLSSTLLHYRLTFSIDRRTNARCRRIQNNCVRNGLAGQFGFVEYQPPEGVIELLAVLVGALMFVLRYFTSTPVFYRK
jgi:hypothetical protein